MAHTSKNTNKKTARGGVRRHRFNPIAVIFFIALLVGAAVVIFLLIQSSKNPVLKAPEDKPAQSEQKSNSSPKEDSSSTVQEKEKREEEKPNVDQYSGEDPNNFDQLTGIINYAGVYEGQFLVRVSIDQSVSGTCDFTLTSPTNKTITGTSSTTAGPSSTFCSYSIDPSESGTWNIVVKVKASDKTGTISGEGEI